MYRLRKVHPPDKVVLDNVSLSFLPGAKIGVLGANGAGKSSLLRDHGRARPRASGRGRAGARRHRGLLPQEPDLDPSKDVRGNIEEGVAETAGLLRRFEEIGARLGEVDPDEMEALLAEYGEVQDEIERRNAWDLDRTLEVAMDALRVPPGDQDVTTLSGGERRRVALCRLLLSAPDLLLLDEPTNHLDAESVAWLERHLEEYPGTVVAVTHDRYFLDNVAGWILELDRGARHPVEGQLLVLARAEAQAAGAGGEAASRRARRPLARELEWVRSSPRARQAKSKARLADYEQPAGRGGRAPRREPSRSAFPPPPRLGDLVMEADGPHQGLRRPAADRGPRRSRSRPAASWASSAPTAPARPPSSG